MNHTKTLVAGIATALSLGYGASALAIPAAGTANATSNLLITMFKISKGNFELGGGTQLQLDQFDELSGFTTGKSTSSLPPLNDSNYFNKVVSFLPQTFSVQSLLGSPTNGARGQSTTAGSALDFDGTGVPGGDGSGDTVTVLASGNLDQTGEAGSTGLQGLASVNFTVVNGFRAQVAFTADLLMLAALGADYNGFAKSVVAWTMTLNDTTVGSESELTWTPRQFGNGLSGFGALFTTAYNYGADATPMATLNKTIQTSPGNYDLSYDPPGQNFEIETTLVAGHRYSLLINHANNIDISQVVPEPTTLALLGLGMLGMGAARRRKA